MTGRGDLSDRDGIPAVVRGLLSWVLAWGVGVAVYCGGTVLYYGRLGYDWRTAAAWSGACWLPAFVLIIPSVSWLERLSRGVGGTVLATVVFAAVAGLPAALLPLVFRGWFSYSSASGLLMAALFLSAGVSFPWIFSASRLLQPSAPKMSA